jgi:hypothetical protein
MGKTANKVIVAVLVLLFTSSSVSAIVGPVQVGLRSSWYYSKPPRANSENSMYITFRINKDIKFHDTINVWYPTGEAVAGDDMKKSICQGLLQLTGDLESPRFLPNSKYFVKYPQSKEKSIYKIYKAEKPNGTIDWALEPGDDAQLDEFIGKLLQKDSNGAIEDESGLGWWLMGTVMPSLPIDQKERYEKLVQISRRQGVGFHWCYEEGFPGLVNDEVQRSIICRPTMEIRSSWKGYNPITYSSTIGTGIISPATPGRYRIAVATTPEPEPVESESFVLPCSWISDVKCFGFQDSNEEQTPEISFKTGEGGALDKNVSTIVIRFPKNLAMTVLPDKTMIKVNGSPLFYKPDVGLVDGCLELNVIVPVNIDSMTQAKITFDKRFLLGLKPTEKEAYVYVMTSSEPEFVRSEPMNLMDVGNVKIFPNEEYTPCSLAFSISNPLGNQQKSTKVSITFPEGFSKDSNIIGKSILVDGQPLNKPAKFAKNVLEFELTWNMSSLAMIYIDESAKMIAPSTGFYYFTVSVNGSKPEVLELYIKPAKPRIANLKVVRNNDMIIRLEFEFRPSSFGNLDKGDWVSLEFPKGYKLSSFVEPDDATINQVPSQSVKVDRQTLIIGLPTSLSVIRMSKFKIDTIIDLNKEFGIDDKLVLCSSKNDQVWAALIKP